MSDQPGYTRMPNALLELLSLLPDAECRVLIVIARKTIGWQKVCDVISYSQLTDATGMSRQGVINGVESAVKRGIIKREPSGHNNGFCYEILADQVVNEVDHLKQSTKCTGQRSRPLVVNEVDHLGASSSQRSRPTKEKILKKEKERDRGGAKRTPRTPKEPTPEIIVLALADVCKIDRTIATKPQRDQLYQSAGILSRAGAKQEQAPEQIADAIRYVAGYYGTHHWRGKKGESPTPANIREVWREAIEARGTKNGKPLRPSLNGHSERKPQVEADPERGF